MPDSDPDVTLPPVPEPDADLTLPPGNPPDPPTLTATGGPDEPAGRPDVPGYEIVQELGRGGMGVVYLARQVKLNRLVALKMVLAGGLAGPKERLRFLQEAESVAAVQHSGIVQVFEFGACGDQPYFALEYCPGGSLAAKLAGTPLPPRQAAELVEPVARAVQAAHAQGIIHRDLKPDNVLFDAAGQPKVTDFGLARKVESDSGLTRTGAIVGTPSYMAPEQAAGQKDIGPPADVWALGAILYECLTGRPPFRAATVLDTILQVASDDPVPPGKLVPTIPRDLETIALKCLQKDPGKRYPSAGDLADDLRRFLDGEPIAARPVSWVEKTWKQARRRPRVAVLTFLTSFFAVFAIMTLIQGILRSRAAHAETLKHLADLDREATAARKAEAVADAQRHKAQARLELAVDAVERLFNRVAGEKWARNPDLADERRQVLEEVVAFYEGFKDEDAKDPLVRRETARAFFQIAGVYQLLAENAEATKALARAEALQTGLTAEFPDDPAYGDELARTLLYTGHVLATSAEFEAAEKTCARAVELARRAVERRPDEDAFRRTLVECLCSHGHSFLFSPSTRGAAADQFREAVIESKRLLRPGAPFANRVLAAYAHVASDNPVAFGAAARALGDNFRIGAEILAATPPDPSAPVRYRDLHELAGVMVKFFEGLQFVRVAAGNAAESRRLRDEAPRQLREAAEGIDRLLAVYPKAFQYRMYKLQILIIESSVLTGMDRTDELHKRLAELFALEDAILRDTPKMAFVRTITLSFRSQDLAWRAGQGEVARFDEQADELLKYVGATMAGEIARYNIACAYSLASRTGTPEVREKRAARAVKELATLAAAGYFKSPDRVKHLQADKDLDPIRNRADFKAFQAGLPVEK